MLPIWTFPLLTVKPPMSFLVFLILALHIKTRERRFCRHGRTHEEYLQFLKTNRNSLHFSIFLAVVMVLAAVADYFLLIFVTAKSAVSAQNPETITTYEQIESFMRIGLAMGFGNSFPLLFVAPFVLLFSYTRNPKNRKLSMLIPVGAIALMVLLLVESVHQGLGIIAARQTEKLSIRELMDVMIQSIMSATG
jgi:asparagine N-glycosylation enzyme membrane subunit Stt3